MMLFVFRDLSVDFANSLRSLSPPLDARNPEKALTEAAALSGLSVPLTGKAGPRSGGDPE
jgi:hypothetical protein